MPHASCLMPQFSRFSKLELGFMHYSYVFYVCLLDFRDNSIPNGQRQGLLGSPKLDFGDTYRISNGKMLQLHSVYSNPPQVLNLHMTLTDRQVRADWCICWSALSACSAWSAWSAWTMICRFGGFSSHFGLVWITYHLEINIVTLMGRFDKFFIAI